MGEEMGPIKFGLVTFVVLAGVFIAIYFARVAIEKINSWMRARPLLSALVIAATLAVVVGVWVSINEPLIECWSRHKLECLFMVKPPI